MSFEPCDIIKFSEAIKSDTNISYKNIEEFDSKIVIVRKVPQIEYKKAILREDIDPFFEKIKDYEVIVFDDCEHICIN